MRGTHRQMRSIPLAFRQEQPVAVFRHPLRTCQMAVVNSPCPIGFPVRVEAKEDLHGFCPVRPVCLGVEETHIKLEVLSS